VVKESGTRLRWLDFGAGDGTLLETVHRIDPEASLFAYDLSTQAEQVVRSRAPISGFYSSMAEIGTDYDVIVLSHVLEHVDNPRAVLVDLIERLSIGGQIVIQVPNVGENPFDLVVFDHVSHFDRFTLEALLQSVGQLNFLSTETVAKEIVASISQDKSRQGSARTIEIGVEFDSLKTTNSIDFMSKRLWRVAEASRREHLNIGTLGIFGTSIAANWVSGFLGDQQTFWVDEDPARIGKTWQGRQIMDLDQMGYGASLLVPFVGGLGTNLLDRILSAATSQRVILL
jgi:SAM-dependent methyltransferase